MARGEPAHESHDDAPPAAPEPPRAPRDPLQHLLRIPTLRRLLRLALFIGLILQFRKLLVLLVFFVAFERSLGGLAHWLARRTRIHRKGALAVVALGLLAVVGGTLVLGAGWLLRAWVGVRDQLPERFAVFRASPLYHQLQEWLEGAGNLVERAQHYALGAFTYVASFGHMLLYALIGLILAVVYFLEREELEAFAAAQDPSSTGGTLLRWFGHVADAISVTLQFQVVVAAINAVLTLPVLLLVGIPHVAAFAFMVFFSGMVPVVGNLVAGAILGVLAYQAKAGSARGCSWASPSCFTRSSRTT